MNITAASINGDGQTVKLNNFLDGTNNEIGIKNQLFHTKLQTYSSQMYETADFFFRVFDVGSIEKVVQFDGLIILLKNCQHIKLDPYTEHSWSRRCSTESILSIQGKETDFVRDTSDTETFASDGGRGLEYEPATESDEDPPVEEDSSGQSDNEIIKTKVIAVSVGDDGDLEFADSEQTDSEGSDSEMDLYDYWHCAQCRAHNNNPLYRYCEKCFKVRKNFFPPRPKRKHKRMPTPETEPEPVPRTLSQDSGVESQELSQNDRDQGTSSKVDRPLKRRAESADRKNKRIKVDYSDSDSDSDSVVVNRQEVIPLSKKTVSDPSLTIDDVKLTKKVISNSLKEKVGDDMCIICCSEPKSGVFVHGRIAHICCCYKCAVKVWAKAKRCPICNCKVSNVLKAVVM